MSQVWYCAQCGYEVNSGGRCHNCKEPLIASPLEELGDGEADDEVGYRLDDWEDALRGELIGTLVDRGIRHRFEGDELVIAADNEDEVDKLIGHADAAGSDGDAGDASDESARRAVVALYDAACRLRADPTDMVADADLAEASGGVFLLDEVPGVDPDTLAAIGRVTRKLLGALGADEALEGEISDSAAVLSRLVKPLIDVVQDEDRSNEQEADHDEVVYELDEWLPEERAQLSLLLERDGISYGWEGADLITPEADEQQVEALFDEVDRSRTGALPVAPEGSDDEALYQALSELFGAADRLAGDPEDEDKQQVLLDAAQAIDEWSTPFGVSEDDWWRIRARARDLAEAIDEQAHRSVIETGAVTLRDLLRGFV